MHDDHPADTQTLLEQQGEINRLRKAVGNAQALAIRWGILRTYGNAATELRCALNGAAPGNTTAAVLAEVYVERHQQDDKWGEQNHRHASAEDTDTARELAEAFKVINDRPEERTWHTIVLQEAYEAGAETDPARIRAELVQVAASAVAQIEAIDRATGGVAGGE
ncbi:NUDIX hydrolase [Streptomyces sp.]|uniref:NUDIX hydrolase n=1 Tax=Streptomyces sp. TaxID=1931 RepID=UPI002D76C523|nr:NUDIX hydrolase [Streptomyces sp.]HET6354637.1 NUDIX hydrolase [Streptomyces sp.]